MWTFADRKKLLMPHPEECLPGRPIAMPVPERHHVLGTPLRPPFPAGLEETTFALGCFWGAERLFWQENGVFSTAVGYTGGHTPNPTYEEVCSGMTGHAEAVLVVFDPKRISYGQLLKIFWEAHDPTQGMRQGNDVGTQYRSAVYWHSEMQRQLAETSRDIFATALARRGRGPVTTEILPASFFYYAEDYHQQYLAKNPGGYCGLKGTGAKLPENFADS
jgi:peptide-methionine (S)-S-oxide reductase